MHKEYVSSLVEAGAYVSKEILKRHSPLWWALRNNLPDHADILLKAGASFDKKDEKKTPPLSAAFLSNQTEIARLLLKHGANPNIVYYSGALCEKRTILGWSISGYYGSKDFPFIKLLLECGPNPNSRHEEYYGTRRSLLSIAIRSQALIDVIRLLLERGAEVNCVDGDGSTPLHSAVWDGREDVVRILLGRGAIKTVSNNRGQRPVDIAQSEDIKKLLQCTFKAESLSVQ